MKPFPLFPGVRKLRAMTGAAATSCALGALMVVPARPAGPPGAIPSPPVAVPPIIIVVELSTTFTPATLQLAVGQQFELLVDGSVDASGPDIPSTCPGIAPAAGSDGMLFAQCVDNGSYLYTAEQPGSFVLSATVRPHCSPGTMCPQWLTEPNLPITITPGLPPASPPTQGPPPGIPPASGPAS